MTLSIRHPEAERLARRLAAQENTSLTQVVLSALKTRARAAASRESPMETADRVLQELGIARPPLSHIPVSPGAYHDLDHDLTGSSD